MPKCKIIYNILHKLIHVVIITRLIKAYILYAGKPANGVELLLSGFLLPFYQIGVRNPTKDKFKKSVCELTHPELFRISDSS